jgi:hypothetical protein
MVLTDKRFSKSKSFNRKSAHHTHTPMTEALSSCLTPFSFTILLSDCFYLYPFPSSYEELWLEWVLASYSSLMRIWTLCISLSGCELPTSVVCGSSFLFIYKDNLWSALLGGSIVFLDVDPSILFFVFPHPQPPFFLGALVYLWFAGFITFGSGFDISTL